MESRKFSRKIIISALVVGGLLSGAFAGASWMQRQDRKDVRVFSKGIQVSVSKSSPPYAAYEDLQEEIEPQATDLNQEAAAVETWIAQFSPVVKDETKVVSLSQLKITKEELLAGLLMPIANSDFPTPALKTKTVESKVVQSLKGTGNGSEANLRGFLQLQDGLAITADDDRLVVYREYTQRIQQTGLVRPKEGTFEILVPERTGELVAELRTGSGAVLGRGRYDLAGHNEKQVLIKIKPIEAGLYGRTEDANGAVAGVNVLAHFDQGQTKSNAKGLYRMSQFMPGSNSIIYAEKEGYRRSLSYAWAGSAQHTFMVSEAQIQKALAEVGEPLGADSGIIWGKVVTNDVPMAGAQIDLPLSEGAGRVIYFNQLLVPDPSLDSTSKNGLFAVVGLSQAIHVVQAKIPGQSVSPAMVAVESGSVSNVRLEVTLNKRLDLRAFEPFENQPITNLRAGIAGGREFQEFNSRGIFRFNGHDSLSFLDVDAGSGYQTMRVSIHADQLNLKVPIVASGWLQSMIAELRVNQLPGTGVVVGFIAHADQAQINLEGLNEQSKIIYFDSKGRVVNAKGSGAGFIAVNVHEGLRTLRLSFPDQPGVFSQTLLVDDNVTSVVQVSASVAK